MSIIRKNKRLLDKLQQQKQNYIPKFRQQPRSRRGSKPRTDFSLFISSSAAASSSSSSGSSSMLPGPTSECSRYRNGQFQIETSSLGQACRAVISRHKKEMPSFPLVQSSVVEIGGQEQISSNSATVQIPLTESVAQNMILENCDDGYRNFQETGTADELASTPSKPTSLIESNDVRMAAGSVVWAKTASDMWWPAKIMEGKSTADVSSDQGADGHVQVQYFGNHENAWLTPDGDISQFDQCFIERSSNPLATFQDALKQALYFKEQLSHRRESDRKSDGFRRSRQEQPSVEPLVKCIESSFSRTEDSLEKGRGKRKRKPKVLFENVNVRTKTARKVRRFRIMRSLGLTAPIGSPFSPASEL